MPDKHISFNFPQIKTILSSSPRVIYYVLQNNMFYSQKPFAFIPQKHCYHTFYVFLLQKDFNIFYMILFGVFVCAFDNIYL